MRHDVVQDLRKRRMDEGIPKDRLPPRAVLAEEAGRDWLLERQKRLGLALEPESVISEAYTRERFSNAKGHRIVVGRLDLRGFATVTNPEALLKALYQGVGCAKGFGFGLLLVRRA